MGNMEPLPRPEITVPLVEETGWAKKHGNLAVATEVEIEIPEEPLFSE